MLPVDALSAEVRFCEWDRASRLKACLIEPTGRYGHNVLGPNSEWSRLSLELGGDGKAASGISIAEIELPTDRVFEDVAPRLVDLDGDTRPEIVIVEASRGQGAEIVVYGHRSAGDHGAALRKIAATLPIGRGFRWRAIAGIADLDGDGRIEIAEVETPHIGGTLRVWSWRDGALVELATLPGFSNHRIGEDFITSIIRDCGDGPEVVLPDFGWRGLYAVRLEAGALGRRALDLPANTVGLARAFACEVS